MNDKKVPNQITLAQAKAHNVPHYVTQQQAESCFELYKYYTDIYPYPEMAQKLFEILEVMSFDGNVDYYVIANLEPIRKSLGII